MPVPIIVASKLTKPLSKDPELAVKKKTTREVNALRKVSRRFSVIEESGDLSSQPNF